MEAGKEAFGVRFEEGDRKSCVVTCKDGG
jgi:hypothetical protein